MRHHLIVGVHLAAATVWWMCSTALAGLGALLIFAGAAQTITLAVGVFFLSAGCAFCGWATTCRLYQIAGWDK